MTRRARIVRRLQAQGPEMVQMPREVHQRALTYMEEQLAGRKSDRGQIEDLHTELRHKNGALELAYDRINSMEYRNVARTGLIVVLAALLVGLMAYPVFEWSQRLPYENAFTTCVETYDAIEPDGVYREDLERHYDNEGRCHLIVAYYGEDDFTELFNDPQRVDEVRNIGGE